jgi:type I restriction modification DNA specificity domain protein
MMPIEEVCKGHYGKGNTIPKDGGEYPVYGCNGIVGMTSTYNSEDAPIVGHIGSAGLVTWGEGKHFVTYNGTICEPIRDKINGRYLYHQLINLHLEKYVKGNQPFLSFSDFQKVKIAVPTLDVQSRIVSILDKFDILTTSISEGLPKEIELRRKQYEYYRNQLLSFPDNKATA